MLADIASGNVDASDVILLIACVLAVVGAILHLAAPARWPAAGAFLGWLAVAGISLGLLLL